MTAIRHSRSTALRTALLAGAATAVAAALGACGSSSTKTDKPGTPVAIASDSTSSPSGAASSATSSGSVSSGGSHPPVNVCSAVSAAAASAATGRAFTSTNESDQTGDYTCSYNGDGLHWSITVYQSPSRVTFDDLLTDLGGSANAKPVSGVGDKAFIAPVALVAQIGDRYLEVGSPNNSADNEAGYTSLAKAAIAALT
jgi:hypothetical protein